MSDWYDRAFGPWYLKLYPHRDRAEAERALALVEPRLPREGPVLDAGCGPGRHLGVLRDRGRTAFGLDRSAALLGEARRAGAAPGRLARGDMRRLPFRDGAFGSVLSMFTSFGYFETDAEHRGLLAEFARVVRGGGLLVLDYLNAAAVRDGLVPLTRRSVQGHEVVERRRVSTGGGRPRVVKELVIRDGRGREVERYEESVALYDDDMIREMMASAGWSADTAFGDYDGAPWTARAPRLILLAQRRPS